MNRIFIFLILVAIGGCIEHKEDFEYWKIHSLYTVTIKVSDNSSKKKYFWEFSEKTGKFKITKYRMLSVETDRFKPEYYLQYESSLLKENIFPVENFKIFTKQDEKTIDIGSISIPFVYKIYLFILHPNVFPVLLLSFALMVLLSFLYLNRKKKSDHFEKRKSSGVEAGVVYEKIYGVRWEDEPEKIKTSKVATAFEEEEEIPFTFKKELEESEEISRAFLIQKEGPNPGRQFTLNSPEIIIGKSETSDLVLWDYSLSPRHAKIKRYNKRFVLFDLVSVNSVYLNGRKLIRPRVLHDFDEIRIGKTILIFRGK